MEKIVASVEGIIFRNEDNGYTVAEIALGDELETCVGMLPGLREGERVELSGTWKTHPSYGRQFAVDACRPLPPEGEEGRSYRPADCGGLWTAGAGYYPLRP